METKLQVLEKTLLTDPLPEIEGDAAKLVAKKFLLLIAKFEVESGETLDSRQDDPAAVAEMDEFERGGYELFNLARRVVPSFYEECVYAIKATEAQ